MFDFHMHSSVSFDAFTEAKEMVDAAASAGIKQNCFTDHLDYDPLADPDKFVFDTQIYNETYDNLYHPDVEIFRGIEFGMLPDNVETMEADLKRRRFDFVLGSVHFVEDVDIYYDTFWKGKTMDQAEQRYLEETLACVKAHDGFDVLGHLTYACKAMSNPTHRPILYERHKDLVDEILRTLAQKGKGLEVNTSGLDPCGVFLPTADYLRRFKELSGEIVTVGSDAHNAERVGQYCQEACQMVADIFGYVCTFADRKPVFHKL